MLRAPVWLGLAALAFAAAGTGVVAADANTVEADPRPWLGISYGRDGEVGILVTNVFEESAAIACGLRIGDEIVEIDGQITPPGSDLSPLIQPRQIGEKLTMRVYRGDRLVTLHPVLARRISDAELLHVQLVGRRAPAFSLIQPLAPEAEPIDDSQLVGKVGVLAWFHSQCSSCTAVVNKLAPWVDAHRGVVGLAGIGGQPNMSIDQLVTATSAILKSSPVLLPVGIDPDAWLKYSVLEDVQNKLAVVIVDRQGIVQMAAVINAQTADDAALDDVFAAAERALKQRKPRR